MKKVFLFMFYLALPVFCFAQTIAVADFTPNTRLIADQMTAVTDVFRNALTETNVVILTTDADSADYVISGSVTRITDSPDDLPDLSGGDYTGNDFPMEDFSSLLQPVTAIVGMTGLPVSLAPQLLQVFGSIPPRKKPQAAAPKQQYHTTTISAQMVSRENRTIIAVAAITCHSYEEYVRNVSDFAAQFLNKLPGTGVLSGAWTGALSAGGIEDKYTLVFNGNNKCSVTVTGSDGRTQTAAGNYRYNDQILSISANFKAPVIPHIKKIDWKAVINMANDHTSFSIVVPSSSEQNAKRGKITFWKEE